MNYIYLLNICEDGKNLNSYFFTNVNHALKKADEIKATSTCFTGYQLFRIETLSKYSNLEDSSSFELVKECEY